MVWVVEVMKKRILIVSPFPPPFGGISRYSQDILESTLKNEFELEYFDTSRGERFVRMSNRGERSWRRLWKFLVPRNWLYLGGVLFSFPEFLVRIIIRRPNLVHVHTSSYFGFLRSGAYLFLSRVLGAKRVLHLHNAIDIFYFEETKGHLGRAVLRWVMAQADRLIVLSNGLKVVVEQIIDRPISVVYNACEQNGLEISRREELDKKHPEWKYKIFFLLVGGASRGKGAFDLIEAAGNLPSEVLERCVFIIVGRGDINQARALVHQRKLDSIVIVAGTVDDNTKVLYLTASDVFVLPSYSEGQPIAILEAMAAGLPVISTNVGSIKEILACDGGDVIEPGDIEGLKELLLRYATDKKKREHSGARNRRVAADRHTKERVFSDLREIYRNELKTVG